ncbi:ribosome assembly protein RRB1 protein [Dioscorea alata]|uniref:Ribosome assembly protein RRB1 protein n=1 Tax=Dioscorea alata TaxID=55571 RepID=A0ACB7V284_DIOAL|nr:ribosome assembly protein RRB1 protein [Dioscorea alata]
MVRSLKNPKKLKRKNKGSKKGDSSSVPSAPAKVWRPGVDQLEEGEELQCDPSAYNYLHAFSIGWPCLSFDIVHDSLGLIRTEFPHTLYGVAGTQAEQASWNYIALFKLSNISGKKRELMPVAGDGDEEMDSDSSSDEDEEDGDGGDKQPVLQLHKVAHQGCVNRIRSMAQKPHICATWADTGHVQVWDFTSALNSLAESEADVRTGDNSIHQGSTLMKFGGHKNEGYAIDWSPIVPGRLVSGDCNSCIHLWEPSLETWKVNTTPFVGHDASVEDLQWSPTEADVFASCSVDGKIAIWDSRLGNKPALSIKAHNTDVNVISWNRLASCMIASGSDDGTFSIRDLRLIKGESLVAHFEYHKLPITSIEWSPHEASTISVSSADNQLTIWDLSLERDEEEEAEFKAKMKEQVNAPEDLPPQLLFVHQGQKDLKELHWHKQIPGMLLSTAADGFNVLMPSNVETTLPSTTS